MNRNGFMNLYEFRSSELVFDERETREILVFFFPMEKALVARAEVTDSVRALAQGLLVAAVDASNDLGWVESLWRSTVVSGNGIRSALAKIVKKGGAQWFRNAKRSNDILNARIYESVRVELSRRFRTDLLSMLLAKAGGHGHFQFNRLAYVGWCCGGNTT